MDDKSWDKLFTTATLTFYQAEDVIVADGVKNDNMYRVVSGQVRVEKGNDIAQVGQGAVLNSLGSGHTFGEMSFLDGSLPCANCIAEGDDVQVMKLSKQGMEALLEQDSELRCAFYKQMAINVTQRLQKVSKTTADIREAPRGLAQQDNAASSLSAKKLLKIRRRLGIPDAEHMASMTQCMMISPAKRKSHGTLYVFETAVGFVAKVFGMKQQEVVPYSTVSEVLRETFTLKKEDGGIEIVVGAGTKAYQFFPTTLVDDTFDAINRCRFAEAKTKGVDGQELTKRVDDQVANDPHKQQAPDAPAMGALLEKATLEKYKAGELVIEEGTRPRTLFNLAKGRVAVEIQRLNEATQMPESVKILTLYPGAVFGEMSFLTGEVACANVVAELDSEINQIKAANIEGMLTSEGSASQATFYWHLATYLTARVRQLTDMVGESLASRGSQVSLEEVLSNTVFFSIFKKYLAENKLVDGKLLPFMQELNAYLDCPSATGALNMARDIAGKYLMGEGAVATNQDVVTQIGAQLAKQEPPPRDLFTPVLAEVYGALSKNAFKLFQQSPAFQPCLELKAKETQVPDISEYKLLQILGEGYEGKVLQARKKDCGCMYAVKVLDKVILAQRSRRWRLHCSRERECLIECDNPYIVRMIYCFQTPQYLYMVQEHVPSHTMAEYLVAHDGRPVEEQGVRFMVAELTLALAHMHSKQMLYRDLKPANVLIDEHGHLRVVDMGMATKLDPETGRRKSVCGTQRYMAPEMKNKEPYNHSVDWYSLGKLIVDCQGRNPYAEETRFWETSGLLDLVEGLLQKIPDKRLGCGADGVASIQRHRFFATTDWEALNAKKVESPLRREWYVREPDLTLSRQFRNGEDIAKVVEKLQHISLDTGAAAGTIASENHVSPGMVENWDYVNPRAPYDEYMYSPYQNFKSAYS